MPNRAHDWLNQAKQDLEQAQDSRTAGRHEWACFAAQQAAEKAVKALHLARGQEAWGHVIARLMQELPLRGHPWTIWLRRQGCWIIFISPPAIPTAIPRAHLLSIMVLSKVKWPSPMPVRLLTSPVLKWPDAASVVQALGQWVNSQVQARPEIVKIGYFGSYARGDWGVGSDLDLIIIVDQARHPFEMRGVVWNTLACRCRPICWFILRRNGRISPLQGNRGTPAGGKLSGFIPESKK